MFPKVMGRAVLFSHIVGMSMCVRHKGIKKRVLSVVVVDLDLGTVTSCSAWQSTYTIVCSQIQCSSSFFLFQSNLSRLFASSSFFSLPYLFLSGVHWSIWLAIFPGANLRVCLSQTRHHLQITDTTSWLVRSLTS